VYYLDSFLLRLFPVTHRPLLCIQLQGPLSIESKGQSHILTPISKPIWVYGIQEARITTIIGVNQIYLAYYLSESLHVWSDNQDTCVEVVRWKDIGSSCKVCARVLDHLSKAIEYLGRDNKAICIDIEDKFVLN
jgi:hypothetical protein